MSEIIPIISLHKYAPSFLVLNCLFEFIQSSKGRSVILITVSFTLPFRNFFRSSKSKGLSPKPFFPHLQGFPNPSPHFYFCCNFHFPFLSFFFSEILFDLPKVVPPNVFSILLYLCQGFQYSTLFTFFWNPLLPPICFSQFVKRVLTCNRRQQSPQRSSFTEVRQRRVRGSR